MPKLLEFCGVLGINQNIFVNITDSFSVFARVSFLPNIRCDEIGAAKDFITENFQVGHLIIVDRYPNRSIRGSEQSP